MVWSWTEPVNFGDWIGPLIFEARCGVPPLFHRLNRRTGGTAYVTVGSIMPHIRRDDAAIVWGAGIITRTDDFARPLRIHAVRGPLTRRRCVDQGYGCPETYGDPAILLPAYLERPEADARFPVGIVPHFVNYAEARSLFAGTSDIMVVDVRRPVHDVVGAILSCRTVLSSSLHGLIVAHSYGVPATWVKFSAPLKGDDVKFHDYFLAGGVADPPAAARIAGERPVADLVALALTGPMPDNESLRLKLTNACPF
jgi:hypothetical protein